MMTTGDYFTGLYRDLPFGKEDEYQRLQPSSIINRSYMTVVCKSKTFFSRSLDVSAARQMVDGVCSYTDKFQFVPQIIGASKQLTKYQFAEKVAKWPPVIA